MTRAWVLAVILFCLVAVTANAKRTEPGWPEYHRPAPTPTATVAVPIRTVTAFVTAYSCEAHPNNPMGGLCGAPRWGQPGDQWSPGLACPVEWQGYTVRVRGYVYRCDDTPRNSYIEGMPHLDERVSSYDEAIGLGIRIIEVEVLNEP